MTFPSEWVIRFRWPIIAIFLAITALFATRLPGIEIDPEIKNQLPPDMPARENVHKIEERFGGSEPVMVILSAPDVLQASTLERVRAIGDDLAKVKTFTRIVSPFTLTDISGSPDGMMLVEPAIARIPTDDAGRAALRERLKANDLVFGNVMASDFSAVAIIAMLSTEASDAETVAELHRVVDAHPGPEAVTYGGMPDIRQHVSDDIRSDIRRFAPFGVAVIIVFLFATLRQLRGVVLPFSIQIMSIIVSMGLIPVLGWKVQMVTVTLPVILLAVGNDHAIHLVAQYQELNVPGTTKTAGELTKEVLERLGLPIVAAGTTTVAGLLCLLTHIVVPAVQLGWLAAWGVTFAMAASLLFGPAVLSILPVPKPVAGAGVHGEGHGLDLALNRLAKFVAARPRAVLAGCLVFAVVAASGIPLVEVDTNPINYYPRSAPVAVTALEVNDHFGGSTEIAVMVEGDIQDPETMKKIDRLERDLKAMPQIGYTMSIATVVRKMNQAVSGGDPAQAKIPDTKEAIAQLFLLYSMGGSSEDFERMVDFDFEHAVVTARINSLSTTEIKGVVDEIHREVLSDFKDNNVVVGGFGTVFSDLVDAVVSGQVSSLTLSIVVVAVLDALVFGSIGAGLWSIVPLLVAVPMLFGLMGYAGIELNVVTAMLSSIMIGVGVDYTIHYLWRYRELRRSGISPEESVIETMNSVGRGILFNALSVVFGFSILFLSNFLPVRFFGFLVVVSIGGCLLAAFLLLPSLCVVFKPGFAEPKKG
ncbi:MAG: RND family transporter [Alphaproteobacteria bacterium]|nr:RND family transporter [Alphaproteobacteria bacterium]MCB9695538.1 RND family transporter [Alphaproteobacteria bacterium]